MSRNKDAGMATPTWSLPFRTQNHLLQAVPQGIHNLIATATTSNTIASLDTIVRLLPLFFSTEVSTVAPVLHVLSVGCIRSFVCSVQVRHLSSSTELKANGDHESEILGSALETVSVSILPVAIKWFAKTILQSSSTVCITAVILAYNSTVAPTRYKELRIQIHYCAVPQKALGLSTFRTRSDIHTDITQTVVRVLRTAGL